MQQILSVWTALDPRRRTIVIGATILMFAAVIGLSRIAAQPSFTLLYSGLEPSAAGEVVAALEQRGIAHEVRGGAIFVPSTDRDQLRMVLASEGLPANSTSGYELLDSLSGFGTTAQMFDAAYWRAKEGELARTIVSSPQISAARVHIANPSSSPFTRGTAATASVTVTTISGSVSTQQAQGYKYLVASAVSGLSAEDVSVIDGRRGVVISGDDPLSGLPESSDKAETLRQNVLRLLEARVGKGRAVVEVSVEPVTDVESITERRFDPDTRVAISTQTEERTTSSTDTRNGAVTVASNLPNGNAANGGDASSNNSETRESINYEVSETTRELQRMPGAVKRLTVAVLIDGITTLDPETEAAVWSARSDDELSALEALVASAIGLDEARGDSLTIRSMEFEPVLVEGTAASPSPFTLANLDIMRILQLAVLTVVSLVLGLFVVRPILAKPVTVPALVSPVSENQPLGDTSLPALESPSFDPPALTNSMDDGGFELPSLGVVSDFDLGEDFGMPTDPVKRLKKLIEDREEETVEILRSWIEDAEGTA
ncbi:flagellar basal-body MS-ring/collar protein FliF [Celeribacter marinus]|uniref:Flagellar M-ring protein n=1 Tax=Celeribacter marinus TaxID=1397108 RepID=A0A0N7HIN0_9RHOB|nr:flagellar basal-body MS-ring/collar protein FliF [Celeribacter marinus]ALI55677.1 flagellar M-ring protein FliF [Celeribacter marinus]SFK25836.1 flagellar M-ring protein FliF [Celeribacter marinus]